MKQKMVVNIYVDELDMRDEVSTRPTPSEELKPIQLGDQPEHFIYIEYKLAEDIKSPVIRFLKQKWRYSPGSGKTWEESTRR